MFTNAVDRFPESFSMSSATRVVSLDLTKTFARSSHSTAEMFTNAVDRFSDSFSMSSGTRVVSLDLTKTFARVWHVGLLELPVRFSTLLLCNTQLSLVLDGNSL